MHPWDKSEAPGLWRAKGVFQVAVTLLLLTLTFLGDADGATAHAHTQSVHTSVNEILGLSCCHN